MEDLLAKKLILDFSREENLTVKRIPTSSNIYLKIVEGDNEILLDLFFYKDSLHLENIRCLNKGTGFGSYIMDLIKDFCTDSNIILFAEDVMNYDFFVKQDFEPVIDDPENPYGYKAQWVWMN